MVFVFKIGKSEEPRLVCVCFLLAAKEKASAWLFNQSNTFTEDEKECKGLGRDQHIYKTEVVIIWGDNIETMEGVKGEIHFIKYKFKPCLKQIHHTKGRSDKSGGGGGVGMESCFRLQHFDLLFAPLSR